MRRITSRNNASVARYRTVAKNGDQQVVLLDGVRLIRDALTSGVTFEHVIVGAEAVGSSDLQPLIDELRNRAREVAVGSAPVMSAVSPLRSSSRIVALVRRPTISERMFASPDPFVLIACDVQDPGNVGAIVRVAEAAGASGMIAAGQIADPFGWKAIRGSMGSVLRLPIDRSLSVEEAIARARRHGCRIAATVPRGGEPLFGADLKGALAVLIGGEGQGLADAVLAASDLQVTIPMRPPVESLNAAVTSALVAYEARRRRN